VLPLHRHSGHQAAGFRLVSTEGSAPVEKGCYDMTWEFEGGFCWPGVAMSSGK
jgi:hypothetical protein